MDPKIRKYIHDSLLRRQYSHHGQRPRRHSIPTSTSPAPRRKLHKSLSSSALPITTNKKERELAMKYNPLAYWELTDTIASAFDFSHDGKLLAVTTMQGHLAL